jgi:hypothetical protein
MMVVMLLGEFLKAAEVALRHSSPLNPKPLDGSYTAGVRFDKFAPGKAFVAELCRKRLPVLAEKGYARP